MDTHEVSLFETAWCVFRNWTDEKEKMELHFCFTLLSFVGRDEKEW